MAANDPEDVASVYADASPTPGKPLTKATSPAGWFTSTAAEGYIQELLNRFESRHPEAARELGYIANEAKWSTGWKGFGRMLEDLA
jgi:hypothetical protein